MLLCNHRSRHALARCTCCAASPAATKLVYDLAKNSVAAAPCPAERLGVPLHVVSAAGTWWLVLHQNAALIATAWSPATGGWAARGGCSRMMQPWANQKS